MQQAEKTIVISMMWLVLIQSIGFACGTLWRRYLKRLAIQQIEICSFGMIDISVCGVQKQLKNLRCGGMLSKLVMVSKEMNGWLIGMKFVLHGFRHTLPIYTL
jgi:hypothetical protein